MASAIQVQVDVHSLRSAQLQIELKRRGLSSSGKKSDLRRRLEEVRIITHSKQTLVYIVMGLKVLAIVYLYLFSKTCRLLCCQYVKCALFGV